MVENIFWSVVIVLLVGTFVDIIFNTFIKK